MVLVSILKSCTNSKSKTKEKGNKMHRFPKDISLCYEWLTNCNRSDLCDKTFNNYRVCSKHFVSKMYANPEQIFLLPTAVPTKFAVTSSNRTSISECSLTSSSMCTQTTQLLSVNTPRKKNLRTYICELKKKCKQLEKGINANTKKISEMLKSVDHFNEIVDTHLPPNLAMLMKNYVKHF